MDTVNSIRNEQNGPQNFTFHLQGPKNSIAKQIAYFLQMFTDWFGANAVSGFDWRKPQVVGDEGGEAKKHTYECPPEHMCSAKQLIGRCGPHVIPTTKYNVEHITLLPDTSDGRILQAIANSHESPDLHFIFFYGLSGQENELLCPVGSIATGMRVKSEPGLGMTGLEMKCSHLSPQPAPAGYIKSKTLRAEISTNVGKWASEETSISTPISGFYFDWSKGKHEEGFDVFFGPLLKPKDPPPHDETKFCPENQKICGFSYRTDKLPLNKSGT